MSAEAPAPPLPTAAVASLTTYVSEGTDPIVLGVFGGALLLGALALVKYFGSALKIK
jgi:hypothetical protein